LPLKDTLHSGSFILFTTSFGQHLVHWTVFSNLYAVLERFFHAFNVFHYLEYACDSLVNIQVHVSILA